MSFLSDDQIEELGRLAEQADRRTQKDLFDGTIVNENDYTSTFVSRLRDLIKQESKFGLTATSKLLSGRQERQVGGDAAIILSAGSNSKIAVFEAKWPRFNTPGYEWDSIQKRTKGSHFNSQVERQKHWHGDLAVFAMFYSEFRGEQTPQYLEPEGSTCVWHEDVERYERHRRRSGQPWTQGDVRELLKTKKIRLRQVLEAFGKCEKGKPVPWRNPELLADQFDLPNLLLEISSRKEAQSASARRGAVPNLRQSTSTKSNMASSQVKPKTDMSEPLAKCNESVIEDAALEWFGELGYAVGHGPHIAPSEPAAERDSFGEVVLVGRLRDAIRRLNPAIPEEAREEALRKVLRVGTPSLTQTNRAFHRMLRDGVPVEYPRPDGSIAGDHVRLVDFGDVLANDWFVVNQFTVIEEQHNRRPDIVVFLNGLPLGLIELKNATDEDATIWSAYAQLQTYKAEIASLLHYNAALVVSDGLQARMGSVTANQEWFKVWRTIDGEGDAPKTALELEVLVRGVFERQRFLGLLHHFIVFEEDPDTGALHKIIAGYHQFHAVNAAVEETVRASGMTGNDSVLREDEGTYWSGRQRGGKPGDRRAGVVWHTQGSGKSFSMLFFAARVVRHPAMQNPTLVVLTDRNDLDDQLFGQFQRCADILGQTPVQASGRDHLRELLNRASGGVVFTTIHKFMPEKGEAMPELSARQNIVVIADEAHRSQYGFGGKVNEKTGEMSYGFASNLRDALPNASFIGFTGTPIEKTDANTRAVFGGYISIYDIQRAVADKATVPIFYESRISKLSLNAAELPKLDAEFEEITEGEELTKKEKLKTKWAALEALVGDPKRIALVAADLVAHFEKRVEAMDGKAMIVCMSRRICVDLYDALIKLRPEWAEEALKVVMTGSAEDGPEWQKHIRSKDARRKLANRFKDAKDPFKIVIVRDMWLTGFDAPCLHTMYADKPMQGHGLMQAIARVNRVFRDKPGGLVVDYLGLADQLKKALITYTESGGQGNPTFDTAQAIAVMLEKHGIACDMMHGFNWDKWTTGKPTERLALIPAGQEHILEQEDGKKRWVRVVAELSSAFALCAASDEATAIRDDVSFFQALQAALNKQSTNNKKTPEQIDAAIRQLVSKAITTEGQVIDVFTAAGLPKPDISILSDQFLAEVRGLKHKNVAAELLEKLLKDELKVRSKRNLVQSQVFSEKLKKTLNAYHNRAISTMQVIEELIKLAKDLDAATKRGEDMGLTDDEIAFYDALASNDSAVQAMGDDKLKLIAAELITQVKKSVTIDWTLRESARAKIKVMVKRILNKHGYPPDLQEEAVKTVLAQAELLCAEWV